jgi:hypothetical protein
MYLIVKLCLLSFYALNLIVIKIVHGNLIVENRGEVNNHEHNNNAEITLETQSWENQQIMALVWL